MDNLLDHLCETVTRARTVEELTRPLLELLEDITGFESTYLTVVDLERGVQRVLYARNTRQVQIPEGLSAPWHDTLCKRALDEGRPFTADVGQRWGYSQVGAALGIQTYASTPVRMADGQLYGQGFGQRLAQARRGRFGGADAPIDYAGASVGVIAVLPNGMTADEALREADRAMYAAKKARRAVR